MLAGIAVAAPALHAQATATASTDENFRATPNGTRLATVREGARLRVGEQRDHWRSAALEGWIWAASVRPDQRDGHDLIVSAGGGENLRAEPNGTILARLLPGMLLTRVEEQERWIRVRREGWIWDASINIERTDHAAPTTTAPIPSPSSPSVERTRAHASDAGIELLGAPGRDTIAHIRRRTGFDVLATEGNWARVRLEGWVWAPALDADADDSVLTNLSPRDLEAEPDDFRGRIIEWEIQYIALERAETIRADFYDGEPYILARGPGDTPTFVYIAVPADRVNDISRTAPLERIRVRARVRNGWSRLLDAPVLDLVDVLDPSTDPPAP